MNQETVTECKKLLYRCLVVPADLEVANPNSHLSVVLLGLSVVFAGGGGLSTSPFVLCMAPVELPCISLDRPDGFKRLVFTHIEKHNQKYSICNDTQHILYPPP